MKWAKLDRALANTTFMNFFPLGSMHYLARKSSDHKPMLINLSKSFEWYGPRTFKFQSMWTLHDNFVPIVRKIQAKTLIGLGLTKLAAKLESTKKILREWNKEVFGHVDTNIQDLEQRLNKLEDELQKGHNVELEFEFLLNKGELEC